METIMIDGYETGSSEFRGKTLIYVKDRQDGGYTGWYKEREDVVAQGETLNELGEAVDEAYEVVKAWEKEEK